MVKGLASDFNINNVSTRKKPLTRNAREKLSCFNIELTSFTECQVSKMKSLFGDESGKRQLQKYYLTINLKEAHTLFLWSCEQKDKYSFPTFCAYSPKNVLLHGSTPKAQ